MAVALSIVGSAILLFSCETAKVVPQDASSLDEFMTEYSENLSMFQLENQMYSYLFETPLMEGYTLARDPYREFRKGIHITKYDADSVGLVSATLTANYAIFYENRKLWEAKGDVVVIQMDGKRLYTSQLFWNQATHRIYSNVDSKIVDGDEIYNCEGFESDESMHDWTYRKLKGVTYFTETDSADSLSSDSSAVNGRERIDGKESAARTAGMTSAKGVTVRKSGATRVVPVRKSDSAQKDASSAESIQPVTIQQPQKSTTTQQQTGALRVPGSNNIGGSVDINQVVKK